MLSMLLFCLGFFVGPSFADDCPSGKTRDGCAPGTRDQIGCCPIPKKSSWGKAASSSGCKSGLVVEGGHCCWPDQAWSGSACVGTPKCPSGKKVSGSKCVAPSCPSGQVKTSGHCCWPGQFWSSSGKKCVGMPECPKGFRLSGSKCVKKSSGKRKSSGVKGSLKYSVKLIPSGSFTMGCTSEQQSALSG